MEKEDMILTAQLIESISEALDKLEFARDKKDLEEFRRAKNTIISFQAELDKIL